MDIDLVIDCFILHTYTIVYSRLVIEYADERCFKVTLGCQKSKPVVEGLSIHIITRNEAHFIGHSPLEERKHRLHLEDVALCKEEHMIELGVDAL